jgi:hypothetical protein
MWRPDLQQAFAAALLDPSLPVPEAVAALGGASRAARFAVYRNNVIVGLIDALAARYPVTQQLVGEAFFRAMAGEYVRAEPPQDPVLWHYGDGLPAFIEQFGPADALPYLADVARLERAWSEAWAAAEAASLSGADLAGLTPERLLRARATVHPALRLLSSPHPAGSLWSCHQAGATVVAPDPWGPEDLLVTRPQAEVQVRRLPPGALQGLQVLANGATVEAALAGFAMAAPETDPAQLLGLALEAGALSALHWEIP